MHDNTGQLVLLRAKTLQRFDPEFLLLSSRHLSSWFVLQSLLWVTNLFFWCCQRWLGPPGMIGRWRLMPSADWQHVRIQWRDWDCSVWPEGLLVSKVWAGIRPSYSQAHWLTIYSSHQMNERQGGHNNWNYLDQLTVIYVQQQHV